MADSLAAPAFAPVPIRARRDGWTPERQLRFISSLHECRCPSKAARAVGMSRIGAYALRRKPGAASFAAAWDAALAAPPAQPPGPSSYERAMHGRMVPYFYAGKRRGETRRHDDRALCNILRSLHSSRDRLRALRRARRSEDFHDSDSKL